MGDQLVERPGGLRVRREGLLAGEVKVGAMPAYRAAPVSDPRAPVVLVVEEIFGVHEHIRDVCRRLAKRGYFAVAPELFATAMSFINSLLPPPAGHEGDRAKPGRESESAWAPLALTEPTYKAAEENNEL